ncbi:MAG: FIST C-terminal domain-containing protein [Myxococcota bacterium]|nr:FIST C-terminal domain-containing protein [Myxococcota bacterium]
MANPIARQVVATGANTETVAREIVEKLEAPDLRIAFVFADWQHDPGVFARDTQRGLAPAVVVGGTTTGVIGSGVPRDGVSAVGLGLYGDWLHVGVGVAADLPKSALTRSRDAVQRAAVSMGRSSSGLDPSRHVAITLVEGRCGQEEAFCIGSAAAAPQIRFVGGSTSTEVEGGRKPYIWLGGEVMTDAGLVIILESELPFEVVSSAHLVATETKTVVTAATGRVIEELDGRPALMRLREITAYLGDEITRPRPASHSFARYVDGVPYVRSITHFEGESIHLASAVEAGHVLRVMRPGDLIGQTIKDLALAAEKVGGSIGALLAFSCIARHFEATSKNLESELAAAYAQYDAVGYQSFGEQAGMLLVNHTLMGLAVGSRR